jgi:membrane associated rhomboid family serine protease
MFPIRDHNPPSRTPWLTWLLIVVNVVVFIGTLPYFESERRLYVFFLEWGLVPARVMAGEGWETFLTSMFLHGGWLHLLGNMLFLFIFGDNLEDEMGRPGFLAFYLASGLGAGLLQVAADPASVVPMVGASGAIAGVMGGYLLLHPKARVDVLFIIVFFVRIVPVPAWIVLGLWLAIQIFSGLSDPGGDGGVAYWAHVGGFVVGAVLALPLFLRLGGPEFWARTRGAPPNPEARYRLSASSLPKVKRRR